MYGIWSDAAGGVIAVEDTRDAIEKTRAALIAEGENAEDLEFCHMCPDHEEQRADCCDEC